MKISEMTACHIPDAARLFIQRFSEQKHEVSLLDETHVSEENVSSMLTGAVAQSGGVVLCEGDTLIGFMTGFFIEELLGPYEGVFVPEWAHAVKGDKAFDYYRQLYRGAAEKWAKRDLLTHAISLLNTEKEGQEAFLWSGFGYECFDAMRPVERLPVSPLPGLTIRPVSKSMIQQWLPMARELCLHIQKAPVFKGGSETPNEEELREILDTEGVKVFMAFMDEKPAGFMKLMPVEDGAAWIINGINKFCINGAYTYPHYRGLGISKHLLNEVMAWGLTHGFTRCSVDFEAANQEACSFWLKHFMPVCRSMVKRLDSRTIKRSD